MVSGAEPRTSAVAACISRIPIASVEVLSPVLA